MTYKERIAKIRKYNPRMAEKIEFLRAKYHDLYEMDVVKFEKLFRKVSAMCVYNGEFLSREESLERLSKRNNP